MCAFVITKRTWWYVFPSNYCHTTLGFYNPRNHWSPNISQFRLPCYLQGLLTLQSLFVSCQIPEGWRSQTRVGLLDSCQIGLDSNAVRCYFYHNLRCTIPNCANINLAFSQSITKVKSRLGKKKSHVSKTCLLIPQNTHLYINVQVSSPTCQLVDLLQKLLDVILHLFDLSGVGALTLGTHMEQSKNTTLFPHI